MLTTFYAPLKAELILRRLQKKNGVQTPKIAVNYFQPKIIPKGLASMTYCEMLVFANF